jgi:hypothetical protein
MSNHEEEDQNPSEGSPDSPDSNGAPDTQKPKPDFLKNAKEAKGAAAELEKASGFVAERVRSRANGMRADWEGHQMEGLRMNFNADHYMNAHSLGVALLKLSTGSIPILEKTINAGFRVVRSSDKDFGDALMVLDIYLSIATQSVPGVSLASAEKAQTEISKVVGDMGDKAAFLGILGLFYPPLLGFEAVAGALKGTQMLIEDPLNNAIRRVRQEMNAQNEAGAVNAELRQAHLRTAENTPPDVVAEPVKKAA